MDRISVEKLYAYYGAYLRAKVQMVEFQSFGGSIVDSARKTVANYEELETAFISQMLADRRASDAVFKAKSGL